MTFCIFTPGWCILSLGKYDFTRLSGESYATPFD